MSWTIDIIASDVYVNTDADGQADATVVNNIVAQNAAVVYTLEIVAGDPDVKLEISSELLGNNVLSYSRTWAQKYTLKTVPLAWDGSYWDIIEGIAKRPYHYVVCDGSYHNWRHSVNTYYACVIEELKVEHKHETGKKIITLTIVLTRR